MTENDYGQRLKRWLDRFGFLADPFAVWEADQERSAIPYIFIDRPHVHYLVGDPQQPQSAFLLARRGEGKTATREIVRYECTEGRLRSRALPVRYSDFTFLLNLAANEPSKLTLHHHAAAIARATLQALADDVPPKHLTQLEPPERSLLQALLQAYADSFTRFKLSNILQLGSEPAFELDSVSPTEVLALLTRLVRQIGPSRDHRYEALYILVDRPDETVAGAEGGAYILRPLLVESVLQGIPALAFKFFLTADLRRTVLQAVRPDRIRIETMQWDEAALHTMIDQRLAYYSGNRIEQFGELCATAARRTAFDRLISKSHSSPRTLLRLCATLVRRHVDQSDELFIDAKDVNAALSEFDQRLEWLASDRLRVPENAADDPSQLASEDVGIRLDDGGHVWLDGIPLDPPLTTLEFRLLQTLYQAAPEIVGTEELIRAVWDSEPWTSEARLSTADEQNLRKLIARLRTRLERPGAREAQAYVRNAHGRGYWLNPVPADQL